MKYLLITGITFFIFFAAIGQAQPKFEKVAKANIDQGRLEFAITLADKILSAQKNGGFYEFSAEEADPRVIAGLPEDAQKQAYHQVTALFGEYKGIVFDHLMKSSQGPLYEIYRFKGKFEKEEAEVEVRLVLDADGKLAGYFIKPWKENL